MKVRAQQNDTVDLLCHRYLGQTRGVTETVLTLNPGLCEQTRLETGQTVILPDTLPVPQTAIIHLWE